MERESLGERAGLEKKGIVEVFFSLKNTFLGGGGGRGLFRLKRKLRLGVSIDFTGLCVRLFEITNGPRLIFKRHNTKKS